MKRISRNALTNIVGAALAAWMGDQAIAGKLTLEKVIYAAPVAIVNFATGSKDSKLTELERRLNLSPSDRAAAKGIGEIVLNQIANRFGYRVTSNDFSFDSRDRSNLLGSGTVGGVRDQYTDRGDRLNAELLDRMADGSDYGDRGALPAPAVRVAEDYFDRQRRNGRRLPNIPIAGTDITPERFSEISMGGIEDADGPRSEAW